MLTASAITVRGGFIYLDLSSFKSNVGIGSCAVYSANGGVKPSKDISLGSIGSLAGSAYPKTGIWNTAGQILVGPSLSAGDYLITQPRVIPVPAGVTFS